MRFRSTVLAVLAAAPALLAWQAPRAAELSPLLNLQYDAVDFDTRDPRFASRDDLRRARVGFKLKAARWQFVVEHDFTERSAADAYAEFAPAKGHALRAGQFKQPFLLEDAISDKHLPFLEQSLLGAFSINRRLGVEYAHEGAAGTANIAAFGQRVDGTQRTQGVAARGTLRLPVSAGAIAHVGASLARETPELPRASFSANAGSQLVDARALSTGRIAGARHIDRAALEALWIRGAWSAQAEAARVRVARTGEAFDGTAASAMLTYSPTGNTRGYKRGVPGALALGDGVAWELALRASAADLDDAGVRGGRATALAVAATCHVNEHLKVMAALGRTQRAGAARDIAMAGVRMQLTY